MNIFSSLLSLVFMVVSGGLKILGRMLLFMDGLLCSLVMLSLKIGRIVVGLYPLAISLLKNIVVMLWKSALFVFWM